MIGWSLDVFYINSNCIQEKGFMVDWWTKVNRFYKIKKAKKKKKKDGGRNVDWVGSETDIGYLRWRINTKQCKGIQRNKGTVYGEKVLITLNWWRSN